MKLYDSGRAPNPRRVRWVLAEKDVTDIELVDIDILKGAHRTPEYLALVGIPSVPAFELKSGEVITESLAICRYLESLYPEPNLFGRTAEEIAVIEMWTRRAELLMANPLMMLVRHTHPALAVLEKQSPEEADKYRTAAERSFKLFERALATREFIAVDRITIADIVAFIALDFSRMAKFKLPETVPHMLAWAERMRARPAVTAGL